jgi:exosome complex protein LRP1
LDSITDSLRMTDDGRATLSACQEAVNNIRNHLEMLLVTKDPVNLAEATNELSQIDSAKLHFGLAYTLDSLFFMYLRLSGINPSTHAVSKELERAKSYSAKINKAVGKLPPKPTLAVDLQASLRMVNAVLGTSQTRKGDNNPEQKVSPTMTATEHAPSKKTETQSKPKKKKTHNKTSSGSKSNAPNSTEKRKSLESLDNIRQLKKPKV